VFQRVDKDAATASDTHLASEKEHKKGQLTDIMHSFPTGYLPLISHNENVYLLQVLQYLFVIASTSKARVQHTLEVPAYSNRKKATHQVRY